MSSLYIKKFTKWVCYQSCWTAEDTGFSASILICDHWQDSPRNRFFCRHDRKPTLLIFNKIFLILSYTLLAVSDLRVSTLWKPELKHVQFYNSLNYSSWNYLKHGQLSLHKIFMHYYIFSVKFNPHLLKKHVYMYIWVLGRGVNLWCFCVMYCTYTNFLNLLHPKN